MAVFARRRLQMMIVGLSHLLDDAKMRDLIGRIESKRIDQALPAEIELGILWALSQLGEVEIE
ncbi:MAG TPA: hypothetical protein VK913_09405, partial [Erythrobacter sp.]|nr:hypothetical protein [Erythrobacter sp.]